MGEIDIKLIWKSGEDKQPANYPQEAIDALISKQPQGIVDRFVKTLRIELVINIVSLLVVAIVMLWSRNWLLAGFLTGFNVLQYVYYKKLIGQLKVDFVDANVVEYLQDMQKLIKRFINHYRVFIVLLMIPACWVMRLLLVDFFSEVFSSETSLWTGCISIVAVLMLVSLMVLHLMYGKKSARIKEMIDSLQQDEG